MNVLEEKIAEDILLLDIHDIASFTDYFIICSGTSDRMIDGIGKAVSESSRSLGIHAKIQGNSSSGWVVADLGDIVVHIFSPDQRDYYLLEQLWERGKVLVHLQ